MKVTYTYRIPKITWVWKDSVEHDKSYATVEEATAEGKKAIDAAIEKMTVEIGLIATH